MLIFSALLDISIPESSRRFYTVDNYIWMSLGFVKNKKVEKAIYGLTNSIVIAVEQGEIPMALFLDLPKAFDYVDHRKLLE